MQVSESENPSGKPSDSTGFQKPWFAVKIDSKAPQHCIHVQSPRQLNPSVQAAACPKASKHVAPDSMWRRAHLSPVLQRGVRVRVQEALALRGSDGDPNGLTFAPSSAPGRAGISEEASAEARLRSPLHWHRRGEGAGRSGPGSIGLASAHGARSSGAAGRSLPPVRPGREQALP